MQAGTCTPSLPLGSMVLVADDDEPIRELWKAILSRCPGVCVIDADDGLEAVRMARKLQPDVIIMDLKMPTLDGLGATRRLKENIATARIPVIAVTGAVFDAQGVLDVGCEAYLLKPVAPQHLIDKIAEVLRRRGVGRSPEPAS